MLWCAPASSATIIQDVSGTSREPNPINFFDSNLGTLISVQVEGTLNSNMSLVRTDMFNGNPALSIPQSASASLTLGYSAGLGFTTLTGSESYAAGSIFGGIYLSGALFSLLTGSSVNDFITNGVRSDLVLPWESSLPVPVAGSRLYTGDELTYSLRVTYNYISIADVPEPTTWVMMLLGFIAIAFAVRRDADSFGSFVRHPI
jgi:hypothetical protein